MASPGGRLGRSWRRWRRRPVAVQGAVVVVALGVVIGVAFAVAGSGSSGARHGAGATGATGGTAPDRASTSSAGVSAHAINVVFPVSDLQALSLNLGFATDVEYTEQAQAINLFVGQINDAGGIHGRRINPVIVTFDPTNETAMRALCKEWTEGDTPAFAVLDGVGTWTGDNQLCITEEGHTPLLSQWTTVTDWVRKGSPYLWWTGPDDAAILQATVRWGLGDGLIGHDRKVGVVAGPAIRRRSPSTSFPISSGRASPPSSRPWPPIPPTPPPPTARLRSSSSSSAAPA